MSLFLAYSYCTGLAKNEEIGIDEQVSKNRREAYIFIRNFSSNTKDKSRKIIVITVLSFSICYSNIQSSEAIGVISLNSKN